MAQRFVPPFNNSGVTAETWQDMAQHFLKSGVLPDVLNGLEVTADGASLTVTTKSGGAWLRGWYYENDAPVVVPIKPADTTNRVDTVVVRLTKTPGTTTGSVALAVVKGTPGAGPPALSDTDDLVEVRVRNGNVTVRGGTGVIAAADVPALTPVLVRNLTEAAASAAYEPKRTEVFVSASSMSAVSGAPTLGVLAVRHPVWLLDPALVENVGGGWYVPPGWSKVVVELLWSKPGAAAAGNVEWQVVMDHADDLGSLNVTGPFLVQTASTPEQNALKRTGVGAGSAAVFPVTPGGWTNIRVSRRGADAADTFTEDVALLGARILKVA